MRLSLRTHILIGAVLWTIGLFAIAGVAVTQAMLWHPHVPVVVHDAFSYVVPVSLGAAACMVLGFIQVRGGLSAMDRLRVRVAAVHDGSERRVDGSYPSEVQPLVDDLNGLLEQRENAVRRALAKAGDLAHGLKTPLAILSQDAERAALEGETELAGSIAQQVERMRRHVEYHLAHARAAASGGRGAARCSIRESVDGLARALLRLHAARGLTIDVEVGEGETVRCGREDLDEMLGNLLDNACKWAHRRIVVSAGRAGGRQVISVDDDGGGLSEEKREEVLRRGVRADEAAPGSGLGLAIVRDLAELYGGSIGLDASPMGGLRATVRLPDE